MTTESNPAAPIAPSTDTPAANAAPAAPPTPAAPPPAPVSPPVPPAPAPDNDPNPPWLAARLERERKAVLKDLGVENPADAKTALAAYRAEQDAKKSDAQKAAEEIARLKADNAEFAEYKTAVSMQATAALAALTPERREAVIKLAGDSPAKQLVAIETLRPTWATPSQAPPPAGAPPAPPPPLPAPANTTPANPVPSGQAQPSDNHLAVWEGLKKQGLHHRAADYYLKHQAAISAAQNQPRSS